MFADVIRWVGDRALIFMVRMAVLFGAAWAIEGMVNRELGYHVEFGPMFVFMIVALVTIRVWMPWSTPTRDG